MTLRKEAVNPIPDVFHVSGMPVDTDLELTGIFHLVLSVLHES